MARASGRVVRGEVDKSDFKTSTKFFTSLQNEVRQSLHEDEGTSGKKRKVDADPSEKSSRFKL